MEPDFRETFTLAARQALVLIESKGLEFSFDCEADPISLKVSTDKLSGSLRRLLIASSELLKVGTVHMSALTYEAQSGQVEALLQYGGVGKTATGDETVRILKWLRLRELPAQACEGMSLKADGICPATGAAVSFKGIIGQEFLLSTCLPSSGDAKTASICLLDANHARVWLVVANQTKADAWRRRFERLGWVTHVFASYEDVVSHLDQSSDFSTPKLVLGMATEGDRAADMEKVCARLGHVAKLVYAVPAGSASLQSPEAVSGYTVLVYPLSPATLESLTEAAAEEGEVSAMTSPLPLDKVGTRNVLLVDDDDVNVLISKKILESLGYPVRSVHGGIAAINACRPQPPDIVVMDLDMPDFDGFQTARTLRDLQTEGMLPPFPILGMTGDWSMEKRSEALAAGMDDCIAKPIDKMKLRGEVNRLCTLR